MSTKTTTPIARVAGPGLLLALAASSVAVAGTRPAILLTGYWPPSNEMIRRFSPNLEQNPDGWIGEDWEGRGYDVYAYFPEFDPPDCGNCGQGMGDLEVDYQDTSADFWPIADGVAPIAVVTFSRGANNTSWELEMNQFNRDSWVNDYTPPLQPTPSPPDDSVPVGYLRPSQLPVTAIVDAVNGADLGVEAFVCYTGDGGGFLSEFIAYHGVWYQDIHSDPDDPAFCAAAGHVHVGQQIPWETAEEATKVTLRVMTDFLEQIEIDFFFPDGQPRFIDPFGGTRIRAEVRGRTKDPAPGTGRLHYSTDGVNFTDIPMQEIEENVYNAVFPAFDCGARVFYYFSAESVSGEVVLSPFGAPMATYGADAYNTEITTFDDDFEEDLGWTVENTSGLNSGPWERGTPVGGPLAPDADGDGSGQCFVTGLAEGEDVDGASTTLTSPLMDATDPNSKLVFEQWFATVGTGGFMQIQATDNDGANWRNIEILFQVGSESWVHRELVVNEMPFIENTDAFRVRFRVSDSDPNGTTEAAIDGVKILTGLDCVDPCHADLDGSGAVDFGDILAVLSNWGNAGGPEDLDGSGVVDFGDLLVVLSSWGPCA